MKKIKYSILFLTIFLCSRVQGAENIKSLIQQEGKELAHLTKIEFKNNWIDFKNYFSKKGLVEFACDITISTPISDLVNILPFDETNKTYLKKILYTIFMCSPQNIVYKIGFKSFYFIAQKAEIIGLGVTSKGINNVINILNLPNTLARILIFDFYKQEEKDKNVNVFLVSKMFKEASEGKIVDVIEIQLFLWSNVFIVSSLNKVWFLFLLCHIPLFKDFYLSRSRKNLFSVAWEHLFDNESSVESN